MKVMPNRLDRGFSLYQAEFEKKALDVLRSGWYVLGRQVQCFEKEFAQYLDIGYCAGVASGLDALWIALKMLGIGQGDEVIVQGNAYIASVMGITINGAVPVLLYFRKSHLGVNIFNRHIFCRRQILCIYKQESMLPHYAYHTVHNKFLHAPLKHTAAHQPGVNKHFCNRLFLQYGNRYKSIVPILVFKRKS